MANLNALIGFKGSASDALGTIKLSAQRGRLGPIFADATRLDGKYRLWAGRGELALIADYGADSATLAPATVAPLVAPLDQAKGTPLGPIAQNIAAAIRRTAGNFNATGKLRLVNMRGGGGVRIETADARGPGGARVMVSGGDGITYYWPDARVRVDGDIAMGGGGLPRANVSLRQPRQGGPMSGEARIQPYAVGNSRLALAPVTFQAARDGSTAVNTIAVLDGPVLGRFRPRAEGADQRDDRRSGRRLRVWPRMHRCPLPVTDGGRVAAQCLAHSRCARRAGRWSTRAGRGRCRSAAQTRNLRLGGQLGKSPFALNAAQARLTGGDRFAATGLGLAAGQAGGAGADHRRQPRRAAGQGRRDRALSATRPR